MTLLNRSWTRIMFLLLIGILTVAQIGCSNNSGDSEQTTIPGTSSDSDSVLEPNPTLTESSSESIEEPAEDPEEAGGEQPIEDVAEEPSEETPAEREESLESQVKPVTLSQLSSNAVEQLSYISGGASVTHHYGQAYQCLQTKTGALSLTVGGVFSTREQYKNVPWWGTKIDACKDQLEFGDMVYFVAQGFPLGERVTFTVSGPLGVEETYGIVELVIKRESSRGGGYAIEEQYPAARFTWIPSPALGAGDYIITAHGSTGAVSMPITIHDNLGPNFGVKFGIDEFHPLLLTQGEMIEMILSGFPPNHTASVILYKSATSALNLDIEPSHTLAGNFSEPVGVLDIQVNEDGYALAEFMWPADLPSGMYAFLVPELIRSEGYEAENLMIYSPDLGPALYSTQFAYGGPGSTWCIPYCGWDDTLGAVVANFTTAPPFIDGNLGDWSGIIVGSSSNPVYNETGWNGTADCMASWQLAWNNDNLYVAVTVTDDTHVQTASGNQIFRGDSVDLHFDTARDADFGAGLSPDDFQIIMSPGDFSTSGASAFRYQGTTSGAILDAPDGNIVTVAAQQTANGYTLEAAIPWSDLNLVPNQGLTIGLALNVNDNDTPGTAALEVMVSNMPNRTLTDPTTWGTLTLR